MRLNQYVASATELSRRSADEAIRLGRVSVNGALGFLGQGVESTDSVELDGVTLELPTGTIYVMFHKPSGIVVSRAHQDKSQIIYDILPHQYKNLIAVGRLDKDSSGLLILTNDGQFAQRATHPSFEKAKTYEVTLNRQFAAKDQTQLETGVELEDGLSQLVVEAVADKTLKVSLAEGRNRQIRRTFEALDYRVMALHRTKFGPYQLGELGIGKCSRIDGGLL